MATVGKGWSQGPCTNCAILENMGSSTLTYQTWILRFMEENGETFSRLNSMEWKEKMKEFGACSMRGLEPWLQSARVFELEPLQRASTSYPLGRLAHSPHQRGSSGTPPPRQLCPLMQQVSGSFWIPMAHAQPCLFSETNLSPTCSARIF